MRKDTNDLPNVAVPSSQVDRHRIKHENGIKAVNAGANALLYLLHVCHYEIDQTWCDYTHTHSMFSNCQHGRHGGVTKCISAVKAPLMLLLLHQQSKGKP